MVVLNKSNKSKIITFNINKKKILGTNDFCSILNMFY